MKKQPAPRLFANRLVVVFVIVELIIGLVGLLAGQLAGTDWAFLFRIDSTAVLLGVVTGGAIFGFNVIILLSYEERNPFYRWIYRPFARSILEPFKLLTFEDVLFLSVLSGIGEELFFRGWILVSFENSWVGLVVSSLIFGIVHIWGKEAIGYGIYATFMGFILGAVFIYSGYIIWVPILAHGLNNFFSMLSMKYGLMPVE